MGRTLVVTNDFAPAGGADAWFVRALAGLLPPADVVVYTAADRDEPADDDTHTFPVLRDPARTLLPTAKVRAGVVDAFEAYRCDRVLFGSAAPLGLMAPALRDAGAERIVSATRAAEVWWTRLPISRQVLRRIGDTVDVLTYVGSSTRAAIAPALSAAAAARMVRLTPGVDAGAFRPGSGGGDIRRRYDLAPDAPVVVCASPLTPTSAVPVLLRAFARVSAEIPESRLLVVGGGRRGSRVAGLVQSLGLADRVVLTGSVPRAERPAYLDAGDVFAAPGRSYIGDLQPEEIDLTVLEAQACGLPVVVATSEPRPGTVRAGETGFAVPPRDEAAMALRLVELLRDPATSQRLGRAGRSWVERDWGWDEVRSRLLRILA